MRPATKTPAQSSNHAIRMAQLQKELVHAMADRLEAEFKIRIVRAQIMAEEARQAREVYNQQRSLQFYTNSTKTNGLTAASSAVAASMPPPEEERKQWSDQGAEDSKTEETKSAVAVGGWVFGENTGTASSSKRVVCSKDDSSKTSSIITVAINDKKEAANKRKRVEVSTKESVAELHRARLFAFVNQQSQSPTTVSRTDRRRKMHPLTYAGRGIQW